MTIWKYILEIADYQELTLPKGYEILCVQTQDDQVCLWAHVNPEARPVRVPILICGTGNPAPLTAEGYLGTCQTRGGALVWHVFLG